MTWFSKNDNLSMVLYIVFVFTTDAFLQVENDRTGGIDEVNAVAGGQLVGCGWLPVGAQEHVSILQPSELLVVDGAESQLPQTFHLAAVVDNVTKAVEGTPLLQLFFCLADGARYAEAETRSGVDFNCQI